MEVALGVTDLRLGHAGHPLKHQLDAPEAASPKLGELLPRSRNIIVGALRNRRRLRRSLGGSGPESELVQEIHGGALWRGES